MVVKGTGEVRRQVEPRDGGRPEAGDEFATDAVARIVAGLEHGDRHAGAAQGQPERKPGQAAADDLEGEQRGGHARR